MVVSDCYIPATLPSGKKTGAHKIGGWVDLEILGKRKINCTLPKFNPVLTSLKSIHYTNYTALAPAELKQVKI
jgi:hypothetical protein